MKLKNIHRSQGLIKILFLLFVAFIALGFLSFILNQNVSLSKPKSLLFGLNRDTVVAPIKNSGSYLPSSNTTSGSNVSTKVSVSLSAGNASYEIQPYSEYLILRNNSRVPVTISGWTLKNNKGERPIEQSNNSYVYQNPDVVAIPYGNKFLSPEGTGYAEPIVLQPNESAVLITGGPFTSYSLPVSLSFKENRCTGYLKTYPFTPALENRCPLAQELPGASGLTTQCFDYIKTINRCDNPKDDRNIYDYKTNKTRLELESFSCQQFVEDHLNYNACVIENQDSKDFYSSTWRVFLGSKTELWPKQADKISLFDRDGSLITQITY